MSRNGDGGEAPAETSAANPLAVEVEAVLALVRGAGGTEAGREARAAFEVIRALKAKRELDLLMEEAEGPIDVAAEERLLDEIMHRLDEIDAEAAAEAAACDAGGEGAGAVPPAVGPLAFRSPDPA